MLRSSILVFALALLAPAPARAIRCDSNPGGPEELRLLLKSAGSDIDVGWKADTHNVGVPAGSSIRACLAQCDAATDPECAISGTIEGVTSGTTTIGPPLPLYVDDRKQPVCALVQLPPPGITGTANVQTGVVNGSATVSAVVYLGACPQCSGASAGAAGTCQGGAAPGAACVTEQVTRVRARIGGNLTDVDYRVSRQCLPTGLSGSISQTVSVTTGPASVANPCDPAQGDTDQCAADCSAGCTGTPANGGLHQACCTGTNTACFPSTVDRIGTKTNPTPAWPAPAYPKASSLTLAGAFCAAGHPLLNSDAGLPGPLALLWPAQALWLADSDADGLYDDLDVTCPFDADCDDDGLIDGARSGSEDLNEDGVVDSGETDPHNPDSDGDGLPDGLEKGLAQPERPDATDLTKGFFIPDADPTTQTDPLDGDSDGDGVSDGDEDVNKNGRVDPGEGDPGPAPTTTTVVVTSTTLASTSSTLPGCNDASECRDDNECTEDLCTNRACSNTVPPGIDGAACEVKRAAARAICGGTAIDKKVAAALKKALKGADVKLGKADAATGKKRAKLLKAVRASLTGVRNKAAKAATRRKKPLPAECASDIDTVLGDLLELVPTS